MNKFYRFAIVLLAAFLFLNEPVAQSQYNDQKNILRKAESLGKDFPSLCTVKKIGKSVGGKDIIVITIGSDDTDNKPGIAVVGGLEGSNNLSRELALGFASSLLKESASAEISALLKKVTFYVFPDVSPDATDVFFASFKYEKNSNDTPTDDDRDFAVNEDPYEDLNNDGLITLIRISDPAGNFVESEEDKRIMIPADISKGQVGAYNVFTEGTDNDKDEKFNEDGPGGVIFNKNFTYNYEEFGLNSGLHPVSEPEVKAVADFLYNHYNIYATFAFGPQDNLLTPARSSERQGVPGNSNQAMSDQGRPQSDRRINSVMKSDEPVNKLVSDKYREITGFKGSPSIKSSTGNFMDWSYFHYGRYSFSTPGWAFPVERDKNPDIAFLKFAAENKIEDVFVPWTEIKHPDFPGKKAEVGGIKPFVTINPPATLLDDLILKNYSFIKAIAAMHPELEFLDLKTEDLGDNVFRLSLKVHNKGIFATLTEAGDMNMLTRLMRISLELADNQKIISGQKVQRIQRLEGDKTASFSWLLMGKGNVKVNAGAVNTGFITTNAELK